MIVCSALFSSAIEQLTFSNMSNIYSTTSFRNTYTCVCIDERSLQNKDFYDIVWIIILQCWVRNDHFTSNIEENLFTVVKLCRMYEYLLLHKCGMACFLKHQLPQWQAHDFFKFINNYIDIYKIQHGAAWVFENNVHCFLGVKNLIR